MWGLVVENSAVFLCVGTKVAFLFFVVKSLPFFLFSQNQINFSWKSITFQLCVNLCGIHWKRTKDRRTRGPQKVGWHHWLNGYESQQTLGDSEGQGKPGVLQSIGWQRVRHSWVTEQHPEWYVIHRSLIFKIMETGGWMLNLGEMRVHLSVFFFF